jgi:hypothetical protein
MKFNRKHTVALLLALFTASASAATLTGSYASIPRNADINLSAAGSVDWVHWGLYTETTVNRKAGVTPRIGDFSLVDTPMGFAFVYQYSDNYNGYSWSDGTPEVAVTNTTTGVWCYGTPTIGSGFEFTVPADTATRTLKVYVGVFGGRGQFEASLSDGSAPAYVNSSLANLMGNGPCATYTVTYAAASAGQTLRIRWILSLGTRADANVTLQAAALSASGVNNPPSVFLTSPSDNSKYAAPASITVSASASDFDGSVTKVEFYANTQKVGEDTSSPYSISWNNVQPGYYVLRALASDNGGEVSESPPVEIFVHGSGGSLSGSMAQPPASVNLTTEGTADWGHWGLITNTTFNHKDGVPQQVSNFTKIGDNEVQRLDDNYTGYSWTDGTPTISATGSKTGVFITGVANGFSLSLPADTTTRTVKVYVGLYGAQGNFQAYLSDFSAPAYTDTSLENVFGNSYAVHTLSYTAASSGKTLQIRYRAKALYDADFGNVTLQAATLAGGGGGNSAPTAALTSPANNAVFTAPANITLEASAADSDGTIAKVEFFNGATKLGEDTSNPYSFAWNNVAAGAYSLTARATDNQDATTTSTAVNITVNAAPTVALTSPANNAVFTAPANITLEASAADSDGTIAKVEFFNGVTKLGEDTSSPYSFAWNNVPAGAYSLTARATDNQDATTTSTAVNIAVNAAPTVALTSPANNAVFTAPANITLEASAADSDGTIAKVEFFNGATKLGEDTSSPYSFAWNNVPAGAYSLTARATDDQGATTTSTAVNITVNAAPTVSITNPANDAVFTAPANITLEASAADSDGTIAKVEFFNGVTKLGEDTSSPYSFAWNNVAAGAYTLTARATDNQGATTTSTAVNVTVNNPNNPPTVSITSPTNSTVFTAPASFTIQASASDSDGSVSQVEFFVESTSAGVDTSSPYSAAVNNLAAGSYTLSVVATDNAGAKATNSVNIVVNGAPTVSITNPANDAVFTAPANITLEASAADSDGTIAKVEFSNGVTKLGEGTSSPYSFAWNNVAAGAYTLTARATDNQGATTTSSPISVTVNAAPTVALTSPANNAVFTAPANITLEASAADSDGTIAKVEFFNGVTKLGEDTSSPYSFAWNNVAAGAYTLTARATDNQGATTTSAAVTISVVNNLAPTVAITNPPNGTVLTAPASFTLVATASDSDGSVSQVEFFQGSTSLGVDASDPYSVAVSSLAAGSYALSAVATDNLGAKATNSVGVVVNALPTASITSPTNGQSFIAPASITIAASATDADGTISKVEFFNGATKLGEDTTSPYSFSWNDVAAGSYTLTGKATDNRGAAVTSAEVAISITNSPAMPVTLLNPTWIGTDFVFSFASQSGHTYEVQYTNALGTGTWQVLTTLTGNGLTLSVTNQNAAAKRRFYRVETQ